MNHYHGIVKFKLETLNQVNSSIVSKSEHTKGFTSRECLWLLKGNQVLFSWLSIIFL